MLLSLASRFKSTTGCRISTLLYPANSLVASNNENGGGKARVRERTISRRP